MSLVETIPDHVVQDSLDLAVAEVFSTMLNETSTPAEIETTSNNLDLSGPHVVGTVGFIGEPKGLIYLYFETAFAEYCAGRMLDMSLEEVIECGDEVVNDVIGEITNMTVGTFKNKLADRGMPCRLTIPSIMRGSHLKIEPIHSANRKVFRFDIGGQRLTADVLLQPGD